MWTFYSVGWTVNLGQASTLKWCFLLREVRVEINTDSSSLNKSVEELDTLSTPNSMSSLPRIVLQPGPRDTPQLPAATQSSGHPSQFPVAILGGTFDHLHAGHKILLSMGAWIASSKLIVGVTGTFVSTLPRPSHPDTLHRRCSPQIKIKWTYFRTLFEARIPSSFIPLTLPAWYHLRYCLD
jgi:hypothetical protein